MIEPEEYKMADFSWPFVSMGILALIVLIGAPGPLEDTQRQKVRVSVV